MPNVIFVAPNGDETPVSIDVGETLVQAASIGGVQGIVAECGGAMSCATCHVHVDDTYVGKLPSLSDMEHQMLDFTAAPRTSTSRLACQIVMTDALDGIVVRIADPQL